MQDQFENFMDAHGGDWFDGKVAGVSYENADGSCRQGIARSLQPFDELQLVPEPENPFDSKAIAIRTTDGQQLGYLDGRTARELNRHLKRGVSAKCFVRAVRETNGVCGVSFGLVKIKP